MAPVGFVGLGNMGSALAANLVATGHELLVHDVAGPTRTVEGATFIADLADLVDAVPIVVLSLPDGTASLSVVSAIAARSPRSIADVVDTSTVGLDSAQTIDALLTDAGIGYVDAPVSGGVAGARARTLTVMYSGAPAACDAVMPVLEGLSDHRFHVGDEPGMAQALKLANNFLSATALVAASEAIAFCTSLGLDMATVLEVINSSSGRSAATEDKFVRHVLPGTYDSGFQNTLMAKDLRLYLSAVTTQQTSATIGAVTTDVWQRFAADEPSADFTAIYRHTTTS